MQPQQQQQPSQLQFCNIQFKDLLLKSKQCKVKIVGMIKSIFTHKVIILFISIITFIKIQKYIIQLSINDQIKIRSIKKYNEFQATYQVIKMKFQNFNIGQFPSKYQIFNKDQTRKQYFQFFINKIIQNYNQKPQNQANKRLFSLIYLFLTKNISNPTISPVKKKNSSPFLSKNSNQIIKINTSDSKTYQNQNKLKRSFQSNNENSKISQQQLSKQQMQSYYANKRRRNSQGSILQQLSPDSYKKSNFKQINKIKNQLQINCDLLQKLDSQFQIKFENQIQWKRRYLRIQNSSLLIFKDKMENNFRTKIELFRIKIQYYHRQKNLFDNFCQKMEINHQIKSQQDKSIIALSHQYDYQKILIRAITMNVDQQNISKQNIQILNKFKQSQKVKLQSFKQQLQRASQISPIKEKYQGVFNPIGKLFLVIHKVIVKDFDQQKKNILKVKIKSTNLQFESKKLLLKNQNFIRQGFFIPISNTFQNIFIQAIVSRQEGWIRQQFKDFTLGYTPIEFYKILTKPSGHKFQKINVALKRSIQSSSEITSEAWIQYSLQNYSHFSSIYSQSFANQNDGKIITGLKLEDVDDLSITVDRALRIIGNIALFITAFWRNVYLFKYPRLSKTFFGILLLLFWFAQIKIFIAIGFSLLIFIIFYNHPYIGIPIKLMLEYLFFEHIHPNFIQPLCLGTSQIKYRKWTQSFEQIQKQFNFTQGNKLQKKEKTQKQNVIQYNFKVHDKDFIVTEEVKGFFGKVFQGKKIVQVVSRLISGVVNTIQKLCNMFLWIDGKRTSLLLFLLIIFSGVTSDFLIRLIGSIFCIHRLYKGMNFYKFKHYKRNRKMALFTLRYILNKHFQNLIQNQNIQQKKPLITIQNEQKLDQIISNIDFPISDQNSAKKLKNQIEKLISVYLDINEIKENCIELKSIKQSIYSGSSEQNKNKDKNLTQKNITILQQSTLKEKNANVKLRDIIKIIQTCQTRLQLDWVPGQQGLSNQFQQLKQLTKQTPVIDVWLEHLLINYVLNIPSQLFIKLKHSQEKKQLI